MGDSYPQQGYSNYSQPQAGSSGKGKYIAIGVVVIVVAVILFFLFSGKGNSNAKSNNGSSGSSSSGGNYNCNNALPSASLSQILGINGMKIINSKEISEDFSGKGGLLGFEDLTKEISKDGGFGCIYSNSQNIPYLTLSTICKDPQYSTPKERYDVLKNTNINMKEGVKKQYGYDLNDPQIGVITTIEGLSEDNFLYNYTGHFYFIDDQTGCLISSWWGLSRMNRANDSITSEQAKEIAREIDKNIK